MATAMLLSEHVSAVRAGEGDPAALVGEFRRTAVLVPVVGGGLMSAGHGGVRWIYAFTAEADLARFAVARGSVPDESWEYMSVLGARLLDVVVPAVDGPAGVVLDAASEEPMFFPPLAGIVPEQAAVNEGEGQR